MYKINYITNTGIDQNSGGWGAMSHYVYKQLDQEFEVIVIDKIDPPYPFFQKLISKILRVSGMRGVFTAFASSRLQKIGRLVESKINNSARLNFFHGATPWLNVKSQLPYAVYLDASFFSYVTTYHRSATFDQVQLKNIFKKEAFFLKKAKAVFFSSHFALEQARNAYKLSRKNLFVAGLGGGIPLNETIRKKSSENYFLFVGFDFVGKGGRKAVAALELLRKKYPDVKLKVVGHKPRIIGTDSGIDYVGKIDKDKPGELEKLGLLFSNALALVLPTDRDMTPLVIVEAGYYGCPTISVNNFGITEMIPSVQNGLLLNARPSVKNIAKAMLEVCDNPKYYDGMRDKIQSHYKDKYNWSKVGSFIISKLGI